MANSIIFTINTVSSNSISFFAYNGAIGGTTQFFTNTISTGSNTIYGIWTFNAFVFDSVTHANTLISGNSLTIYPTPTANSFTPSNTVLDFGQTVTFNALIGGGAGPFVSNLIFVSGPAGATINGIIPGNILITNTILTDGIATFIASGPANSISTNGLFTFNVISTDIGTSTYDVFNSVTNSILLDPAPTANSLTPSNTVLDLGQYTTFNILLSGGSNSFTANLIFVSGPGTVNGIVQGNVIQSKTGQTDGVVTFAGYNSFSTNGMYTFNVMVIDTGTTSPYAFNSVGNVITVDTAPTLSVTSKAIGVSTNSITYGNSITINALISGGTGNFIVNWINNGNSLTPIFVVANTATSNTLNVPAVGNYLYSITGNDIGTTTNFAISGSNTIQVVTNTTLTASCTGGGTVGYYTIATVTCTGTATINGQIGWALFVNGGQYGSNAVSSISWSEQAQPGNYNFVFKNTGNANYSNYTTTTSLSVQTLPSGGGFGGGGGNPTTTISTSSTSATTTTVHTTVVATTKNTTSVNSTVSTTSATTLVPTTIASSTPTTTIGSSNNNTQSGTCTYGSFICGILGWFAQLFKSIFG